jgi:hypothetical protein
MSGATRKENVSIDECARDARLVATATGKKWLDVFVSMLAAYHYEVRAVGQVYFLPRATVLEDWEIVRRAS